MERLGLGPDVAARAQPAARLRPHDRLGPGRAAGAARRPRHRLHRARPACCTRSAAPGERRRRRSTSSATSAAAACCSRSASPARVLEARASGRGQVVDAAMVDGASLLSAMFAGMLAAGRWTEERGDNVLDSRRAVVRHLRDARRPLLAVGAIEPKFYAELLAAPRPRGRRRCRRRTTAREWPRVRAALRRGFRDAGRATSGARVFDGTDACVAPVLTFAEARAHPHAVARDAYRRGRGVAQPAPAPRFARTPGAVRRAAAGARRGGRAALADGASARRRSAAAGLGQGLGCADVPGAA